MNDNEIAALMKIDKRLSLESVEDACLAWVDNNGRLWLVSCIGEPLVGEDKIPEPCECAYFVGGGYVCLDSILPSEFKVVTSITSETLAREAKAKREEGQVC